MIKGVLIWAWCMSLIGALIYLIWHPELDPRIIYTSILAWLAGLFTIVAPWD